MWLCRNSRNETFGETSLNMLYTQNFRTLWKSEKVRIVSTNFEYSKIVLVFVLRKWCEFKFCLLSISRKNSKRNLAFFLLREACTLTRTSTEGIATMHYHTVQYIALPSTPIHTEHTHVDPDSTSQCTTPCMLPPPPTPNHNPPPPNPICTQYLYCTVHTCPSFSPERRAT